MRVMILPGQQRLVRITTIWGGPLAALASGGRTVRRRTLFVFVAIVVTVR